MQSNVLFTSAREFNSLYEMMAPKSSNESSKFHKVYIDHDKILNHLIHMENRVIDVLKNLRDKKRNLH